MNKIKIKTLKEEKTNCNYKKIKTKSKTNIKLIHKVIYKTIYII